MADLATLGLAVDSSQVKTATRDLDVFSKSANSAAAAAQKTSDATGKGKDPVKAFASAFKDADANQGSYGKGANKVIDSLSNQFVRLQSTGRQWAQLSAIQKAGVDVNSDAADKIAKMAGALFDLEQAQKKGGAAANDNSKFVGGLAQGIAGALTPARLLGYAMTALSVAATAYYAYQQVAAPSLETSLREQSRLVGLVKDAYRDAAKTAGEFYRESKNVVELQTQQNLIELRKKLAAETASIATMGSQPVYDPLGNATGASESVIAERYRPFKEALEQIAGGAGGSAEAIKTFREAVASIGGSNPEFAAAANELLNFSQKMSDLANNVKESESSLRLLQGKGTAEDRGRLGLTPDKTGENLAAAWDKQLASLSRRNAAMEAEARTVGQSDAAHEKMRTTLLLEDFLYNKGIKNIDAYREQIAKAGDEAAKTAEKLARARINDQIGFDRNTAFLTQEDVQIAQQLKGLYPDVATALSSVEASAMRTNEALRGISSVASQQLTTGLADILDGTKSVSDGFRDMSKAIVRALEEALIKMLIVQPIMRSMQSLFGFSGGGYVGQTGTINVGSYAMPQFDSGGYTGSGSKYQPAGIVHAGEVVWSQRDVARAGGVGMVEAMRKGYRGYADGGIATAPAAPASTTPSAAGGVPSVSFGDINITLPEGTTTENAAAVGQVVAPMIATEVRKVLATESRARGMLNRAY